MAVFILGLVMLPILGLLTSSRQTLTVTTAELVAQTAALEVLDQVMILPFAQVPTGRWQDADLEDGRPMAAGSAHRWHLDPLPGYRRRLAIDLLARDGQPRFKKVTVVVEWENPGRPQPLSLTVAALVANVTP